MIDNRGGYSRFWSILALATAGIALPACSGTSDDTLPRQPLAGRVLLDGKPLSHGTIMFFPEEVSTKQHETVPSGNTIVNGWFSIPRKRAGAGKVQDRGVVGKDREAPGSHGPGRHPCRAPLASGGNHPRTIQRRHRARGRDQGGGNQGIEDRSSIELRSRGHMNNSRLGFTLIELLMVVAIVGMAIMLLLPAAQSARGGRAPRSVCEQPETDRPGHARLSRRTGDAASRR